MGPLVDARENLRLPLTRLYGLDIQEDIEAVGFECQLDGAGEVFAEVLATMAEKYGAGAHRSGVSDGGQGRLHELADAAEIAGGGGDEDLGSAHRKGGC